MCRTPAILPRGRPSGRPYICIVAYRGLYAASAGGVGQGLCIVETYKPHVPTRLVVGGGLGGGISPGSPGGGGGGEKGLGRLFIDPGAWGRGGVGAWGRGGVGHQSEPRDGERPGPRRSPPQSWAHIGAPAPVSASECAPSAQQNRVGVDAHAEEAIGLLVQILALVVARLLMQLARLLHHGPAVTRQ